MSTLISGFRHRAVLSGMLLVMICSISLLRGQGQGSVSFSSVGAPDAKKIYVGTVTGGVLASGSAYAVALYWAPEGTCDESQFTQIGGSATFLTGASAGTFFGGGRTITTPGSPVNGPTLNFQVRAWNTSSGNNYEAVRNSGDPEAKIGKSPIFSLKTKDLTGALETTPNLYAAPGYVGFAIVAYPFAPDIRVHPCDSVTFPGTEAIFSVIASGAGSITYQWLYNGANILDATKSMLFLKDIQPEHDGVYQVMVANEYGVAASRAATLTLLLRRIIATNEGSGTVLKNPDKVHYELGEQVTLTGIPERWYRFDQWADGSLENPRVIIATNGPNEYVAYFSPTTALETVTINSVSRIAPVGMPAILVNGVFITESAVTNYGEAQISMQTTLPNGVLFWTRDGATPDILSSAPYIGSFQLRQSATVRAAAYSSDFSGSIEGDPIRVTIIPLYRISAMTPGGGHVDVSPFSAAFISNSVVTVAAVPDAGWRFLGWLGDISGTDQTNSITINSDQCVRAIFGTTLATNISGSGTIIVTPSVEWYPYGAFVQCFATPELGNSFVLWSMAGVNTNNPLQFSVSTPNPTVSAAFQPLPQSQFALSVIADGFGEVSVSPRGNRYPTRQRVTLTATAAPFQTFLGWSGDATGAQNPLTVTINQSRTITAHFTGRPILATDACPGTFAGNNVRFKLTGELGSPYIIERSSDLEQWSAFLAVTNILGVIEWSPQADPLPRAEFFRVISGQSVTATSDRTRSIFRISRRARQWQTPAPLRLGVSALNPCSALQFPLH